jgi:subtilase family serine protease
VSVLLDRSAPSSAARSVVRWLRDQDLKVVANRRDVGVVEVAGSSAALGRAFGLTLREAQVSGTDLVVPDRAASVPARFADVVEGVAGLVATPSVPMSTATPAAAVEASNECAPYWGERISAQWPSQIKAAARSNRLCGYGPSDLRALYRVPSDIVGTGARIGIVGTYDDPTVRANSDAHFTAAGLTGFAEGQYVVHGTTEDDTACGDREGWSNEQHLDVEAVHALAPKAKVVYWASPTCYTHDIFTTVLDAATSGEVDVLSLSLGSREELGTADDRELLNRAVVQAAARGVSVFAAAGNDGDYSDDGDHQEIDVTSPASSPYVTAVGGLSIGMRRDGSYAAIGGWASTPSFARNGGVIPPGFAGGGGGGASAVYAQPSWQRGVVGADGETAGARMLPDVAAQADPMTGFSTRVQGAAGPYDQTFGGTSLATPTVATLVAMAKARSGLRIGVATPWLYRLAGSAALRDITPPNAAVFSATPIGAGQTWPETVVTWDRRPQSLGSADGWDDLTGLGMPQGQAFFDAFGR